MKERYKGYAEYKDSGIEWIGYIPKEWLTSSIGNVATVKSSKRIFENQYSDEGVPFFRSKEIVELANNRDISVDIYIPYETYKKIKKKNGGPRRGNILITSIGTIGEVWISDGRDFYYKDGNITQLNAGETLEPRYIFYCFKSHLFKEQYSMMSAGSTLMALTIEKIKRLVVLLPPILEQRIIANFLDQKTSEIDSLIADKEKLIELLGEKRQAIITEVVTKGLNPNVKMKDSGVEWIGEIPEHWGISRIKRLTQVKRGASPRPIDDSKYFDENGKYSWVRIADVSSSNKYLYTTKERLSSLGSSLSVKLEPDNIFVSIAGTVGKPAITKIYCCIHDGFVYFPQYKGSIEYLYYVFDTKQPYKGLGKKGTQLNLNTETIGNISIPLPSLNEQDGIVKFIKGYIANNYELVQGLEQQIQKLKEYRQSLIYEAVTGKIDVRNYNQASS